MIKKICNLLIFLTLSVSTHGFTSLYGPTGILKIPTAEVLNNKEYTISSDLALSTEKGNTSLHTYAINLGLIKNTEIGILGNSD